MREWWIGLDENKFARWLSTHENFAFVSAEEHTCTENISVVEKSALDTAMARIKILEKALSSVHEYVLTSHGLQKMIETTLNKSSRLAEEN